MIKERIMAWLVEFSNGGRRFYSSKEKAYETALSYIIDTYDKMIDESPEFEIKRMWREEKDKATNELFRSCVEGDNFECEPLVRVTIMEVR